MVYSIPVKRNEHAQSLNRVELFCPAFLTGVRRSKHSLLILVSLGFSAKRCNEFPPNACRGERRGVWGRAAPISLVRSLRQLCGHEQS
jgi:hypothetical protein